MIYTGKKASDDSDHLVLSSRSSAVEATEEGMPCIECEYFISKEGETKKKGAPGASCYAINRVFVFVVYARCYTSDDVQ